MGVAAPRVLGVCPRLWCQLRLKGDPEVRCLGNQRHKGATGSYRTWPAVPLTTPSASTLKNLGTSLFQDKGASERESRKGKHDCLQDLSTELLSSWREGGGSQLAQPRGPPNIQQTSGMGSTWVS